MMTLYREDMAKALEVLARRQGLSTSYDDVSESGRTKRTKQQNLAKKKRLFSQGDDAEGPPDTKKKFQPGMSLLAMQLVTFSCVHAESTPSRGPTQAKRGKLNLSLSASKTGIISDTFEVFIIYSPIYSHPCDLLGKRVSFGRQG